MNANENIIKLTPDAVAHIQKIITQRGSGIGFRLSVKKSGCSGYMYKPEIVDTIQSTDIQLTTVEGLCVFIDPACVPIIKGTILDLASKELGQKQLFFDNPNVATQCGCGESFNLQDR